MVSSGFDRGHPSGGDCAPEIVKRVLRFVQRGRILLRCGSAFALSLPSLGVSSLDLGRLFNQAALFSFGDFFWRFRVRTDARLGRTSKEFATTATPPPPGTARGRRAE